MSDLRQGLNPQQPVSRLLIWFEGSRTSREHQCSQWQHSNLKYKLRRQHYHVLTFQGDSAGPDVKLTRCRHHFMKVWVEIYAFMLFPLNGENRKTRTVFRQSVRLRRNDRSPRCRRRAPKKSPKVIARGVDSQI